MQKMYVSYVVEMPDGISEQGVERAVDKVQMELHSAIGMPFKLVSVFGPIPAISEDKHRDPVVLDTMFGIPLYTQRLAQLDIHPFNNARAAMEIAAGDAIVVGMVEVLQNAAKASENLADGDATAFVAMLNNLTKELQVIANKVIAK